MLATDGSEFSRGAERIALNIADECGAKLYVVYVVYYNPEHMSMAIQEVETQKSKAREILERVKREAIEREIEVETKIHMAEEIEKGIAEVAKDLYVNLIVMGRRGVRGLAKYFIGSATLGIIPIAPCPVLVAPKGADFRGRGLLAATDGSEVSMRAIEFMCDMASRMQLPVVVLSVAKDASERAKAEEALKKAEEFLKGYNIKAEILLHIGEPYRVILDVVTQRDLDLIVLGNRGLKGVSKLILGSVSEKVVANSDRGVLIVK